MLIFFDIDATLIVTNRAGLGAMRSAGRELFSPDFTTDGLDFAGRLDPLIVTELLERHGVSADAPTMARFRSVYGRHLAERLVDRTGCRALPGVLDLLAHLRTRDGVMLALLTGNYAETGSLKLRACGIDPDWFPVQVWGDDSPHSPPRRDHLPAVGLDRYHARTGRRLEGHRATVIGDTPHDVACAKAHGCRSIAVATGTYSLDALREAGADLAVGDLSDTPRLLEWLLA